MSITSFWNETNIHVLPTLCCSVLEV
jgi:hypothetical protein